MDTGGIDDLDGYREPIEYYESKYTIVSLHVVLLVGCTEFLFPGFLSWLLSTLSLDSTENKEFLSTHFTEIVTLVAFIVVLVGVHEALHYVANRINGYSPTIGFRLMWTWKIPELIPYVVVLDEPLTRKQNVFALIAPLVVINVVAAIALLPVFPSSVSYFAAVGLVINTAGSSGDIYHAVKVARHPPGTVFRNVETGDGVDTFYYVPVQSD